VWEYQLQPNEFSKLKSGGLRNNLDVESIIFLDGRVWSNEKNYLNFRSEQIK
jgi:hypothetical protein